MDEANPHLRQQLTLSQPVTTIGPVVELCQTLGR
jgi:hypothetical protein